MAKVPNPPRPSLSRRLRARLDKASRIAVLAVGSSLRGDDAAGLLTARRLQKLRWPKRPSVKVLLGETAPENLTGEIRAYQPTHLVVIDAIDSEPGDGIALLDLDEARGRWPPSPSAPTTCR